MREKPNPNYAMWGYVELDRREGDYRKFQSCERCGCIVAQGAEGTHDAFFHPDGPIPTVAADQSWTDIPL